MAKSICKSQNPLFFHHLAACQELNPGFIDCLGCFTFTSGKRLKSNRILVQEMTKKLRISTRKNPTNYNISTGPKLVLYLSPDIPVDFELLVLAAIMLKLG